MTATVLRRRWLVNAVTDETAPTPESRVLSRFRRGRTVKRYAALA
jgi:hypothetical protein